jgi:AAA family ATP:ADP antiporter
MADADTAASPARAGEAGWRTSLKRVGVDMRPGEGESATLLFVFLFLLLTFQISTETVRQSTFIDSLGAANLPWVYLLVAVTSYPFLLVYNRFVDRYRVEQLLAVSCLGVAALLIGFWVLMGFGWVWVAIVYYVFTAIVYGLLNSQFWLFANHLFDPRQAKRLFGFVGAGALLGGILGGQVARFASSLLGTRSVLIVGAVLLVLAVGLLRRAAKHRVHLEPRKANGRGREPQKARGGFQVLKQSRLLMAITVVVVLTIATGQIVDLQFNAAVEAQGYTLDQKTAFFGNFFSVMGVAAFVFQLVFTGRIHSRLGIGFALRVLPVTIGIGTIVLLLVDWRGWPFLIVAALVLKIGESGLRYSLDQATRELLFLPVPSELRVRAKSFIDVFVQRGAKGIAALLLLPVTFGLITAVQAGWISLVLVAIWLVLIAVTARVYVDAFRSGLKGRTVEVSIPVDLTDMTTLELLLESLGSSDARQVLHSLEILAANDRGHLVPPLLLYHDEPEVRRRTLRILAETGRTTSSHLVERTLGDKDPDVRAEAVRVLAGMKGTDVVELMLPKLDEGEPGVRAAAVACLANLEDEVHLEEAEEVLRELLSDAEAEVRAEAAKAIGAVHEPRFQTYLIRLLYDTDRGVVREAIAAIRRRVARDGFNPLYVPTLISLLQNRRVRHEVREALVAFGEEAVPALIHFMNEDDEPLWVRRALPKAVASIGTPAAIRALLSGLEHAKDAFHRRKLIESMASADDVEGILGEESGRIQGQINREARRYLEQLAALEGLGLRRKGRVRGATVVWEGETAPTLLDRLLEERTAENLHNLFGLLAVLHGPDEVWPAYHSLLSDQKLERAHALEFLDNTLEGDVKRDVFAVIDDSLLHEKLARANRRFGVVVDNMAMTISHYLDLTVAEDPEASSLVASALYSIHAEQVRGLEGKVRILAEESTDTFVRETAIWVGGRLGLEGLEPDEEE